MACKSSFQALTSTNPQDLTDEVYVTSLISGLQLQDDPNSSTVSTSSTHPNPSESEAAISSVGELPKSCGFLTLARELRDIIYSHLIASGQLEILQVSQQFHDEAKDLLYKRGICRLCLYYEDILSKLEIPNPLTIPSNDKIQNFNILIWVPGYRDLQARSSNRLEKTNPGFVRSVQGIGNCHITLVFPDPANIRMPITVFNFIEFLTTFKLVTLRVHTMYNFHPLDRLNRLELEPCYMQSLRSIGTSLSAALGCPLWKLDTGPNPRYQMSPYAHEQLNLSPSPPFPNAQYLEFHPRKEREIAGGVYH